MLGKRTKAGDSSKAKKKWQEEIEEDGSDSLGSDDDSHHIKNFPLEEDDIEYKKRRKLEEDR
jgi:hypothetical protein